MAKSKGAICPYCGELMKPVSEGYYVLDKSKRYTAYCQCSNCMARGPESDPSFTEEQAIKEAIEKASCWRCMKGGCVDGRESC